MAGGGTGDRRGASSEASEKPEKIKVQTSNGTVVIPVTDKTTVGELRAKASAANGHAPAQGASASTGEPTKEPVAEKKKGCDWAIVLPAVLLQCGSLCCWIFGILVPIVIVRPFALLEDSEDQDGGPKAPEPIRKSTLAALQILYDSDHYLAFVILGFCSVVVPVAKLLVTSLVLIPSDWLPRPLVQAVSRMHTVLTVFSTYQTVDLFVGLLFVSFLQGEAFRSNLEWGFAFFAAYCGISQALLLLLHRRDTSASDAPVLLEANVWLTGFHTALFLVLVYMTSLQPTLDVAIIYQGFAVGRKRLGLLGILLALADQGNVAVGAALVAAALITVLLVPLLAALLALAGGIRARLAAADSSQGQLLLRLAERLSKWSFPDVLALALVTFLFTVQEEHVLTTIPRGSYFDVRDRRLSCFWLAMALGTTGFVLKWTAVQEVPEEEELAVAAQAKYHVLRDEEGASSPTSKPPPTPEPSPEPPPAPPPPPVASPAPPKQLPVAAAGFAEEGMMGRRAQATHPLLARPPPDEEEGAGRRSRGKAAEERSLRSTAATEETSVRGATAEAKHPLVADLDGQTLQESTVAPTSPGLESVAEQQSPATSAAGPPAEGPAGERRHCTFCRRSVLALTVGAWLVWLLLYLVLKSPAEIGSVHVNNALPQILPALNQILHQKLPRSAGDCHDQHVPKPCDGNKPLYEKDGSKSGIGVLARWVTGINTITVNSAHVSESGNPVRPIRIELDGNIGEVTLSIRIQQCFLGGCSTLWDNTDGCCKPNRKFHITATTSCTDGPEGPALAPFTLEGIETSKIALREKILGIVETQVADLTPEFHKIVRSVASDILTGQLKIMHWTFSEVVTRIWRFNIEDGGDCTALFDSM